MGAHAQRKQRMLPDPVTAPIVERIFHEAAGGKTLRSIAAALTSEGIPTPDTYAGQKNGAKAWDPGVVMRLLAHPTYWGEPRAFVTKAVHLTPQERARGGYKHCVVRVSRPLDEQVALPASVAPPLVTRDVAMEVQRRAQVNRVLASRNNRHPDDTLLHGASPAAATAAGRWPSRKPAGEMPTERPPVSINASALCALKARASRSRSRRACLTPPSGNLSASCCSIPGSSPMNWSAAAMRQRRRPPKRR